MAVTPRLEIDLRFAVQGADGGGPLAGTVSANGTHATVTLDEGMVRLPGTRSSLALARTVGAELARLGLTASLRTRHGVVGTAGAVRAPWFQRLISRSPHLRLGSLGALRALRRDGRSPDAQSITLPPPTLLPLAPTVMRGSHRRVTTTHYLPGSGRPRLIFAVASGTWDGKPPREFALLPEVTRIGSSPSADLVLPGLEAEHARIVHTDDDEYVLHLTDPRLRDGAPVLLDQPPDGRILRTGALIALGDWRLAFFREEFADHGRPFGGRVGGEFAVQKPQPERSTRSRPTLPPPPG
ncbi:FHA domain-containing protein [Microcella daejeonensis]|uniref:FHA domain-containing protein n=1 Tax=Microcella daejeonensis TaxID=2994971 RepID=A0A9E8MMG3_9MICO|nr:FHA domain-containing protein [Microcella daejeonensis]WAB82345.1 FHA domain-containing protein [Microcella daejeonensis]